MAKLTRVFQRQFGAGGSVSDFGQFGSLAGGSANFTKDPDVIQSLPAFVNGGWADETISDNRPALEDFNGLDFLTFYQLCYLFQAGIPEYDSSTVYYIGSICQYGGAVYQSLTDSNSGHTPSGDSTNWAVVIKDVFGANVASGASITLGNDGNIFKISGTTNIDNIAIRPSGSIVRLIFLSTLTLSTSGNLILNGGSFSTLANYSLTLVSDGSNWYELSRSPANSFGTAITGLVAGTTYQAATDGFLSVQCHCPSLGDTVKVLCDNNPAPVTEDGIYQVGNTGGGDGRLFIDIVAGNYYKITVYGTATITARFRPL